MTQGSGWDGILQQGETILWQGQPERGIVWRDALSPLGLFGVVFTGFSLFWMGAAASMLRDGPGFPFTLFTLFGLPFLMVGLFMMGGHVVLDAYVRATTWYTLTDRTAFVAREAFGKRTLESYPIAEMDRLELADGVPGDVIFGMAHNAYPKRVAKQRRSRNRLVTGTTVQLGFRRIAEARKVWRLLRDRRAALRRIDRDEAE